MNSALLLFTMMVSAMGAPNGFYHQEYNYRTSSSSYKNHELQHKNDDEGYYAKDGDLEGRLRPKVNAHSQHSEYVNPKLQHAYRMGTDRSDSFGQLHAQDRFQMGDAAYSRPEMGGVVGGVPYNRPDMGGAYGMNQHQSYGVNSDLRQVTASLQAEMEREVQRAVFEHYQRATAYGGVVNQAQIETDRRILEEDLRRNMTMRLQEALKSQYGNQGVRGAYSYSIINGRLQPSANYNNQELDDLRRQMEAHLLRHLEQQVQITYQTRVDTQVHTQRNTYRQVKGGHDNYPSAIQQRPMIYPYPQPQPQPMQPHLQPHPVAPVPDSITTVATRVQTELNEILNKILEDTQRRYFSENSYNSGVNYDSVLAQLQEELRTNITFHFDDQIKRAYGYSNYASKYSTEDIENLRRQIQSNLITKLNRDFIKQKEKFIQSRRMYVTQPIIPANQIYYPVHNGHQREVSEMQRQLQEQMSRQLQTAIMQNSYRQGHTYTNTGAHFNPQAQYQLTLDQMTAELNSNLTRQIELLNAQSRDHMQSEAYEAQLAQMRNQLQHDLTRQLQQGLQQSYSRSSSWSSSSSSRSSDSSNYRPVRGFDPHYGVYGGSANGMGEDCMQGDDPSVYQQQDDDLNKQVETLDQDLTQQTLTHDDLTQQVEDQDLTQHLQDLTQQAQTHDALTQNDDDLTQKVQTHDDLSQQTEDDDDLTQQVQTHDDLTQQAQTHDDLTQQALTHDDLTQQVQTHDDLTQQAQTHDDLTQQAQTHDDLTQVPIHDNLSQQPQSNTRPQPLQTYRPSPYARPAPRQYQNLDWSQSQDLSQQTQTHDDLGQQTLDTQTPQQVQFYRQPLTQQSQSQQSIDIEPPYTSRTAHQLYSHQPPRQGLTPVNQPQQIQPIRPVPVGYQGYRTQYLENQPLSQQSQYLDTPYQQQTFTQTNPDVYQQRRYQPNRYEPPSQYTSTYEWRPQARNPPGTRVNQAVQYYENLASQRSTPTQQTAPRVVSPYAQQSNLGQQRYGSTFQRQDLSGQQIENDDLTQQIQGQSPLPYKPIQQQELNQPSRDLTQQTQDTEFAPLQIGNNIPGRERQNWQYTRYSPTQKPSYAQVLSQRRPNINQPNQPTHDLTQQTEDLTQTQDLTHQNQDLTQQTEDLTQTQDLTHQNQDLTQQTEDLTQTQDLTQQTEDLTVGNQDLTQQTEDLGQQFEDLTQQSQDLTHQSRIPQQNQNLRFPANQHVNQQTQDLTQQNQHLSQQNQDLRLPTQQAQDLTEENHDLTQQTEDLTQQFQDLSQQPQQSQDLRQPHQHQQENQDLTQQTQDDSQEFRDLLNWDGESQSSSRRPNQGQYLQNQDLTQQNQDLTQQTQDLNQQSQDLEDLTQQHEDVYQPIEPQLSTNKILQGPRNQPLAQQTQDLIQQEIDENQQFHNAPDTTFKQQNAEQSTNIDIEEQKRNDAERENQRLIDLLKNKQRPNQQLEYGNANGYAGQVNTRQTQQPPTNFEEPTEPGLIYSNTYQQKQGPGGRSLISPPAQLNYGTVEEPGKVETTRDIEPVEPQVASEVQPVGEAEVVAPAEPSDPDVTTKKPGWWSRLGQNIKNKIG